MKEAIATNNWKDSLLEAHHKNLIKGYYTPISYCNSAKSTKNSEQAIALYKQLLTRHPDQLDLYFSLTDLLESSQEKTQVLLKGACHALKTEDYETAERLCDAAKNDSKNSFVDQLVTLDLLKKQENFSAINQKLTVLAQSFEKSGLKEQILKTYRMLFQLEERPEYC